jgi:hypothetical protein
MIPMGATRYRIEILSLSLFDFVLVCWHLLL